MVGPSASLAVLGPVQAVHSPRLQVVRYPRSQNYCQALSLGMSGFQPLFKRILWHTEYGLAPPQSEEARPGTFSSSRIGLVMGRLLRFGSGQITFTGRIPLGQDPKGGRKGALHHLAVCSPGAERVPVLLSNPWFQITSWASGESSPVRPAPS